MSMNLLDINSISAKRAAGGGGLVSLVSGILPFIPTVYQWKASDIVQNLQGGNKTDPKVLRLSVWGIFFKKKKIQILEKANKAEQMPLPCCISYPDH